MTAAALQNLAEPLDLHARMRPNHPALIEGERSWTYAEFASRVRRFADRLRADGVAEGDLVGVALRDTAEHVALLFALMRIGAAIAPMDWRWTDAERSAIAGHFRVARVLDEPGATPVPDIPATVVDAGWIAAAEEQPGAGGIVRQANLPLVLSLSSGTTGRPTGPLLTHAQMLARMDNQLATLTFNQHDRYLLATPLYFGGGRAFALTHLAIGATMVLFAPPYDAPALVAEVARTGATSTFLVPTLIRRLLALDPEVLEGLASLRLLVSSGASLHPRERREIAQGLASGFFEYFASTEGGGITVLSPEDRKRRNRSVGRAAFMVELEVVGEDDAPLPPGEVGRVRYRGPGVSSGFHNDPEASSAAFRDGWFYPGDLGTMDAEGYLFLMGRAKDVIVRGGVNIYPLEIEEVLGAAPGVKDVAVIGLSHPDLGEEVAAVIVGDADEADLAKACADRLARFKIPSRWERAEALPRNSAGKVLKAELAKRFGG